jgi:hypothetical protein
VPVGQLHLDGHGLTVAADAESHHAARRRFLNHAAQLGGTINRSAVEAYDHVMLVHAGFSRGSVLVDHGDLRSVFFLELQFRKALSGDVVDVDSEVRRSAALFGIIPVPAIVRAHGIGLRRLRGESQRNGKPEKKYAQQHAMHHRVFSRIMVDGR